MYDESHLGKQSLSGIMRVLSENVTSLHKSKPRYKRECFLHIAPKSESFVFHGIGNVEYSEVASRA